MNLRTILHLVRTEIRRSWWILLALFLVLIAFPRVEIYFFLATIATVHIALGDHWARTTAHWRIRPVSRWEWAVSRLLLVLLFFAIPAAIQQGWVMDQTGFSPQVQRIASIEGALTVFDILILVFALATLANGWKGFIGNLLKGVLFIYVIAFAFSDWLDWDLPLREFPPLLVISLSIVATAGMILIMRRVETRWQRFGMLAGLILITFFNALSETTSERPALPTRITETVEHPDWEEGRHPFTRGTALSGMRSTEFISINSLFTHAGNQIIDSPVPPPIWPINQFNAYNASHALFEAIPTDRVILQPGVIRKKRPAQENLIDPDEYGIIRASIHNWNEIAELPIVDGMSELAGKWHLRIETKGRYSAGTDGLRFQVFISHPELLSIPGGAIDPMRNTNSGRSYWRFVADHPDLGESIPLSTNFYETNVEPDLRPILANIHTSKHDLTLYTSRDWKLLWPDSDPLEKWLEGGVLRIFHEEYVGHFR